MPPQLQKHDHFWYPNKDFHLKDNIIHRQQIKLIIGITDCSDSCCKTQEQVFVCHMPFFKSFDVRKKTNHYIKLE